VGAWHNFFFLLAIFFFFRDWESISIDGQDSYQAGTGYCSWEAAQLGLFSFMFGAGTWETSEREMTTDRPGPERMDPAEEG